MRCRLSTTLRRASPSSTAGQPSTCALPALYLSPTRFSLFHRWPASYRCVASSLTLTDALLPLAPLASRLHVCCQLSTSHRRASPSCTAGQPATGALPALYLSPTRFSLLHRWPGGHRCFACSLPLSDALFPFTLLAIQRHAAILLYTSPSRSVSL